MVEKLITFETAKLAKDKGFKIGSRKGYLINGDLGVSQYASLCYNDQEDYPTKYAAPDQSLLQKWLRDIHNIFVIVNVTNTKKSLGNFEVKVSTNNEIEYYKFGFDTYEDALEMGLKEALKLLY